MQKVVQETELNKKIIKEQEGEVNLIQPDLHLCNERENFLSETNNLLRKKKIELDEEMTKKNKTGGVLEEPQFEGQKPQKTETIDLQDMRTLTTYKNQKKKGRIKRGSKLFYLAAFIRNKRKKCTLNGQNLGSLSDLNRHCLRPETAYLIEENLRWLIAAHFYEFPPSRTKIHRLNSLNYENLIDLVLPTYTFKAKKQKESKKGIIYTFENGSLKTHEGWSWRVIQGVDSENVIFTPKKKIGGQEQFFAVLKPKRAIFVDKDYMLEPVWICFDLLPIFEVVSNLPGMKPLERFGEETIDVVRIKKIEELKELKEFEYKLF